MAGRSRVLGVDRAFAPGAVACLVLGAGACVGHPDHSQPTVMTAQAGAGGNGTTGPSGPSTGGATVLGTGGDILVDPVMPCRVPALSGPAVFAQQVFLNSEVARREFFSWTTDEQAAELRRDQVLFSRSERPGLGPGYAFNVLERIAQDDPQSERSMLASLLGGELFAKARYAWIEPWATRMGWPGEDYGRNLIRVVLKPEAWVVLVRGGTVSVVDQQNQPVSLADALANPTRLGVIFYQKDGFAGGPSCQGSFISGSNGYREFILGNLAMVEEWSLGTQQIRDRLSANVDQLSNFLQRTRDCPITTSVEQWNLSVVCGWDRAGSPTSELDAYEQSLAIPSDNYLAVPERIAAMIETLQEDLFDPDPLVITPGRP
ncbi:MAG TPA: hypothetical protein VER11_31015 [Polyangiaceae bacterium]|nr:hypothetical protein [Polyangiaceae bacterium]